MSFSQPAYSIYGLILRLAYSSNAYLNIFNEHEIKLLNSNLDLKVYNIPPFQIKLSSWSSHCALKGQQCFLPAIVSMYPHMCQLLQKFPNRVFYSVSHYTRRIRNHGIFFQISKYVRTSVNLSQISLWVDSTYLNFMKILILFLLPVVLRDQLIYNFHWISTLFLI